MVKTRKAKVMANSTLNLNIDTFSGDPDKVEWFLDQVKDLSKINKWSDEISLLYLKSKLSGSAQEWFASSPSCRKITFPLACTKLKEFFSSESIPTSKMFTLQNIKLLPGETIRNLGHRVETLTNQTYPEVKDKEAIEQIQKLHLLNALPANLREKLMLDDTADFQKLINQASKLSLLQQDMSINSLQTQSIPAQTCGFCSGNHLMKNCPEFLQSISALNANATSKESEFICSQLAAPPETRVVDFGSLPCLFCHRLGHSMSQCYKYMATFNNPQRSFNDYRGGAAWRAQFNNFRGQDRSRFLESPGYRVVSNSNELQQGRSGSGAPHYTDTNRGAIGQRYNNANAYRQNPQSLN